MEMISGPKTEYLLDASLATLHAESREWLSELNFWNEEMSCFYKLLHKNATSSGFPTSELADLEKEMIRITSEDLIRVKNEVETHERTLGAIMKNTSFGEQRQYRERHKMILDDIYALQLAIRRFKKSVFALVKKA
jgi:hypothetical protein